MTEIEIKGTLNEIILVISELDATKLLFSIIIAFLFWFALAIVLIVLYHFHPGRLNQVLSVYRVFSLLGLSVVSLTILTWRIILRLIYRYFQWYVGKYANFS